MKPAHRRRLVPALPTKLIGIDLGGTKIEGVVLDEDRRQIFRSRVPTEREQGYEHILMRAGAMARVLREYAPECKTLGVGTPGSISHRTETLKNSNTVCLNGRDLVADLEQASRLKIRIENDANCFALAEARAGTGRRYDLVFGVILGTGVGAGIVFRGELWSGPQHIAGEWGHHSIDPQGPVCYCGQRGCVETLLSGPALERRFREQSRGANATPEEIFARATQGDPLARAVADEYLDHFGRALANVVSILDPSIIVLGGGLSNIDALYSEGRATVARYVFNDELTTPIERNTLGDSAGVIGAALLTAR